MARTTRKTDIAPSSGPKSSKAIQIGSLGFIQGEIKADKSRGELCQYFGGVPYALPPTGPKRWKRPQSLPNNSYGTEIQPLICRSWTGVCPQPEVVGQESTKSRWTEDCLQCNVWVPTGKAPASGWPVLFFIREFEPFFSFFFKPPAKIPKSACCMSKAGISRLTLSFQMVAFYNGATPTATSRPSSSGKPTVNVSW